MLTCPGKPRPAPVFNVPALLDAERDPLLVTKLQLPPAPPDLIARPQLTGLLNPAPGQGVTLLCAPTGFGKTTALREWAARTERPVAWVSLDRGGQRPGALLELCYRCRAGLDSRWVRCQIETFALQALIQQARGHMADALASIERALLLAEPEGMRQLFTEHGAPMLDLLARVPASSSVPRPYLDRLLRSFQIAKGGTNAANGNGNGNGNGNRLVALRAQYGTPADLLSDREFEVLTKISDGLSNREIADALFVTVGTVKRHTNSIYSKLDVASRTQAIARARALNLIGA